MNKLAKCPTELIDFRETEYVESLFLGVKSVNQEMLDDITVCYSYGIRIGVC